VRWAPTGYQVNATVSASAAGNLPSANTVAAGDTKRERPAGAPDGLTCARDDRVSTPRMIKACTPPVMKGS